MGQSKISKFAFEETEPKMSEETAMKQVMLLLYRYDIDIEAIEDKKIKTATEKTVNNFLKSIMNLKMEVFEEDGQVKVRQFIQHQSENSTIKELVYAELEGKHQTAMRVGDDVSQYDQIDDLMGAMCEAENGDFVVKKLRSSDRKHMQYLGLVFLAQ